MRTYYIFNVNKYYNYMYKDKPFKMYKIIEELYHTKEYDILLSYKYYQRFRKYKCRFKKDYRAGKKSR